MQVIRVSALVVSLVFIEPAYPCSIEINSIERQTNRATHIVIGEVLEVDDKTYTHPEVSDYSIRVVRAATFRVEHVLKGHIEDEILQLSFTVVDSTELFYSAQCIGYPYQIGDRKLLMLGTKQDGGSYKAPRLRPNIIALPQGDLQGSALYEYVSYVSEHGIRPIELLFEGANKYIVGQPIEIEITITNRMPIEISAVATPGSYVLSDESQGLLNLKLDQVGNHYFRGIATPPEKAAFVNVPGGQTRAFTAKLDAYYILPVGSYGLEGNFYLGLTNQIRGQEVKGGLSFGDRWANFGPEFSFSVGEESTLVKSMSWGYLKKHTCECSQTSVEH